MALDLHPIVWYNYVMEMKKSMTFAAGWVQEIDTSDESRERADLLSYISDTHKSVYGYRPRWGREWADNTPIADLRSEAEKLEADVYAEIKRERAIEAHRQAEMAVHHLAVSKAMKPANLTFKPFANLKEMLV